MTAISMRWSKKHLHRLVCHKDSSVFNLRSNLVSSMAPITRGALFRDASSRQMNSSLIIFTSSSWSHNGMSRAPMSGLPSSKIFKSEFTPMATCGGISWALASLSDSDIL
jgi:hypothetical protein